MTTETGSSSSSSSSSSVRRCKYDVFLSFRGEDTRKNFTDHIYHALNRKAIYTFRDDEKLERGKSIKPELFQAIEQSSFAIVVLSTDYASSTWCLEELSKIVECKKAMGLTIFVVFYHVERSDVINQTGDFGKAMAKHQQNQELNKWTEALTEIVNVSKGWDLDERKETEVIQEIVENVSNILDSTSSSIDEDLVGMPFRIEKLLVLLDTIQLDDIRTIGICGEKEIGKTTLAQQVFGKIQKQFEASCFISNVREECTRHGLVHLQKFLCDFLLEIKANIQNVEMGTNILRNRLCDKKVLIVLDDVAQLEHIEKLVGKSGEQNAWFGKGSRIIITTRNKDLVSRYGENNIYEVDKLTENEALQLLCKRAFRKNLPEDEYKDICDEVVKYAGRLPSELDALGSSLSGRPLRLWLSTLARLKGKF